MKSTREQHPDFSEKPELSSTEAVLGVLHQLIENVIQDVSPDGYAKTLGFLYRDLPKASQKQQAVLTMKLKHISTVVEILREGRLKRYP
jgi:hypothetical protein